MHRLTLPATLFALLSTGCATAVHDSKAEADAPRTAEQVASQDSDGESSEDNADKIQDLERKLELSRARLDVAKLQLEAFEHSHETRMSKAQADLSMSKAELSKFAEDDLPARRASAELDLRSAKDRAQEAQEELAQIELMYEDQDLNDKTAEFVVSRGRRQAERAQARIAIQEAQFKTFMEAEIPMERQKLELAVASGEAALKEAEMDGQINRLNKEIAIQEAIHSIESLERDLAKAQQEAQQ